MSPRRRQVLDLLLVGLLCLLLTLQVLHHSPTAGRIALSLALVLPLSFARRWPVPAFAVISAVALLQWCVSDGMPADAALLVSLYAVARLEPRIRAFAAAAVLELGIVMAATRFAPTRDGDVRGIIFLTGLATTALFLGMTQRSRNAYRASVEDRAARLERERDQRGQLAATAERTRIAREMHDIVAHNLQVMITLADGAGMVQQSDPVRSREAMAQVSATGRVALQEMRGLLGVLRTEGDPVDDAPQPGLAELDDLVGRTRAAGLPVNLTVSGTPSLLPATAQATVYRVVQEALTNTLKHGRDVGDVQVRIAWMSECLELEVVDDGTPRRTPPGPGHGLIGMAERLQVHGGIVNTGPGVQCGWQVRARLPLTLG